MALKVSNKNRKKIKQKPLAPLQYVDIEAIKALDHEELKAHIDKSLNPVKQEIPAQQPQFIETNDHSFKVMIALSVVLFLVFVI